jgi:hypothetical protein
MTLLSAAFVEEAGPQFSPNLLPNFEFTCANRWSGLPEARIYRAVGPRIEEVATLPVGREGPPDEGLLELLGPELARLPGPTLVSGGHTIINMANLLEVSDSVLEATNFSLQVLERMQTSHGVRADFLIQVNDLFMEDAGNEIGAKNPNHYRARALKPYVLPVKMASMMRESAARIAREFRIMFCAEKNMADRFKRQVDTKRKAGDARFTLKKENADEVWSVRVGDEDIAWMVNNKPNCVAANAGMLRSIRHLLDANSVDDNYMSYVGVFPLCSIKNVLNGYRVAHEVYGLELPSFYIFFGKGCV